MSSEAHNWDVYAIWEISKVYTDDFQGGVEGQNILPILSPMCFLLNNLSSVCRYLTGPIH